MTPVFFVFSILVFAMAIAVFTLVILKNKIRQLKKEQNNAFQSDKFKHMVEHSNEGIFVVQNLKIKYANTAVLEMMVTAGQPAESLELLDYIFPEDISQVLTHYEQIVFSKQSCVQSTIRLIGQNGKYIWTHFRAMAFEWKNQPAVLVFVRDVTRQKKMELDLQQAQRMEAIGILSGGIAHDFNNVLTTIIGNADIALMGFSGENTNLEEFTNIREAAYRARDLVQQILNISRCSEKDIGPVSLSPVIKEGVKFLQTTLPSDIQIVKKIEKKIHLVNVDSRQAYQVFMNLCTNAAAAMAQTESPCLTIGLENTILSASDKNRPDHLSPGPYVKLSVADNGCGMDTAVLSKIFQPYFTTKSRETNSGLGLATAHGIVQQNNGYIQCESEPGKGSVFSVFWPVYVKKESLVSGQPEQGGRPDVASATILFADDEPEINALASRVFDNFGFKIMTVDSGIAALEKFSMDPEFFDLLITDFGMPQMNGEQLAQKVLAIRPDLPVIVCTGNSEVYNKHKPVNGLTYVNKPYEFRALCALASECIGSRQAA
jgi:PAS domain S-box-containing protein